MDKAELQYLASRVLSNEATPEERKQLNAWFETGLTEGEEFVFTKEDTDSESIKSRLFDAINEQVTPEPLSVQKNKLWYFIYTAAAAVLLVSGIALFYSDKNQDNLNGDKIVINDANPGGNKAILTLENGEVINLSDASDGKLIESDGIVITKTKDGQLVYDLQAAKADGTTEPKFNTISTPRGGQYQLILPDGTQVWLNAASKLKFPSSFLGLKERVVELTGEAYFEVFRDKKHPFKIVSNGNRSQTVEVLGTHFNINAYTDEEITKTTLLEGSLKVVSNPVNTGTTAGESLMLIPGQQAVLEKSKLRAIPHVDMEQVMAWKDGYFQFDRTDLKTVMRQLSRWYDVDIRYEGIVPDLEFGGAIQKNLTLKQILKILNKSEVHFRIEGKEVIVMP